MASTRLTTNTDALSRAADAILARGASPSKNAILNALAAAIAGPGHDWGFLKNAPDGTFLQSGLDRPKISVDAEPRASAWVLHYDERNDWGRAPMLFATREAALRQVAEDRTWWHHADHPFDDVMATLADIGEYTFAPDDDFQDDYDPYQIRLREVPIEDGTVDDLPAADMPGPSNALFLIESPVPYREQGMTWDEALFQDLDAVDAFALQHGLDTDPRCTGWRQTLHRADACRLTASFRPEVWVRDNAMEVDPQGETDWVVDADELEPDQSDLDYLRTSRKAPDWVKDWTGPFTVTLEIEAPATTE